MFGTGLRIGHILGIEIRLDYSWFLVFALVVLILTTGTLPETLRQVGLELPRAHLWLLGFVTTLLFFLSILLHELSHAYVARLYGIPIINITLFIFGGVARLGEEPRSPRAEFLMTVVGPLVSYALAALFGMVALVSWLGMRTSGGLGVFHYVYAPAFWLFLVNGMLATFNLVPGFPLDGGRLLRSALWHFFGDLRWATWVATLTGQGFGLLLMADGAVFLLVPSLRAVFLVHAGWSILIGWFLVQAARTSYRQVLLREALRGVPVREVMTPPVVVLPAGMTVHDAVEQYFLRWRFPSFPVRGANEQLAELTTEAVRALPRRQWPYTPVSAVAHPLLAEELLAPDDDAWEAMLRMAVRDRPRLLVVEDGDVVGIVSRTSLLQLWDTKRRLGL